MKKLLCPIIALFVYVCGCSEPQTPSSPVQSPPQTPSNTPSPSSENAPVAKMKVKITAQEYGKRWPFKVEEGILKRHNTGTVIGSTEMTEILFIANGKTYAVNGTAKGTKKYADITEIWADDPSFTFGGAKKDIGIIIDRGLKLPEIAAPIQSTAAAQKRASGKLSQDLERKATQYNQVLHQIQDLNEKHIADSRKQLRALNEWETAHGELSGDKPYPPSLTSFSKTTQASQDKVIQTLRKAATLYKNLKNTSDFGTYYKETEPVLEDDNLPGTPKEQDSFRLNFIERR